MCVCARAPLCTLVQVHVCMCLFKTKSVDTLPSVFLCVPRWRSSRTGRGMKYKWNCCYLLFVSLFCCEDFSPHLKHPTENRLKTTTEQEFAVESYIFGIYAILNEASSVCCTFPQVLRFGAAQPRVCTSEL